MSIPIHIISTRKLKSGGKMKLEKIGVNIGDYDFVLIKQKDQKEIEEPLKKNASPLVFTSHYAVTAIQNLVPTLPEKRAFTIDGVTEREAKKIGLTIIGTAPNGHELAQIIITSEQKSILHLTSNIRRHDFEKMLLEAKVQTEILEVYEKIPSPKKVGNLDGVLFWSPSQIDTFLSVNHLPEDIPAFCIGTTTAIHLRNSGHKNIIISPESSEKSMIESVIDYFS